jgi:O-antigen/teichoic acid export membrane protein
MFNLKKHIVYLSHFVTGQVLLQLLNILNGFFLLRWLSIAEQAKFSVAFSIQSLILSLYDFGFTGSIVALVGNRIDDKKAVGAYIQSAKRLRNYLFFFSALITICFLPLIIHKQSWSYIDLAVIMTPVLLAVLWQADCSLYDSTLIMHKKMKELYKPQIGLAAAKLGINFLLSISGFISAFTTLTLNAFTLLINGKVFKKAAIPYVDVASEEDTKVKFREMVDYLKPLFPSLIFNALYGQIQIFIVSFFGNTANIAEIAALGKLTQIFVFFGSINGMIVTPFIAKSSKEKLIKNILIVMGVSLALAACIYLVASFMPGLLLFLLGPKYYHLRYLLHIMVLNACLSYVAGTLWTISSARKWLFWWGTIGYILTVIVTQLAGVMMFDLSQTLGVLQLALLTGLGTLGIHIAIGLVGIRKEYIELKNTFTI